MKSELSGLRQRFGLLIAVLLWLHVPIMLGVSILAGRDWLWPVIVAALLAAVYTLSFRLRGPAPVTRYISAVALMAEPAMLVFIMRGHAWQMDMHMYFFAMLALTIAWFDRRPILLAAAAVALHHITLLYLLPAAVFPAEGTLQRVLLHAGIVAFQTAVLVWLADMIAATFRRMGEMNAALQEATSAAEKGRAEAESANRAKSMFLANMSHEIRTPLNAILGFCHLLQRSAMTPRQEDHTRKIADAGSALLRLINDILDYSKNEAGKLTLESAPFSPHSVIEQQLQLVVVDAQSKGLALEVQKDPNLPVTVMGDGLRFGQVILNLVSNAVKFTEAGSVTVRTGIRSQSEDEIELVVDVIDTGIGMTPEQQERLFSSFTQADNTMTRRFGGTGLGLAISRQIVRMMGGEIVLRSRPWEGTTFSITVRLGRDLNRRAAEIRPHPSLARLRILAIDDNPASRSLVQDMFEGWSMRVEVAESASAGIARLTAADAAGTPFDLALIDWKMPGVDGIDALRMIRADPNIRAKPRMVIVTAYGSDELLRELESGESVAFLGKPLEPRTVVATLDEIFGTRSVPQSDTSGPAQVPTQSGSVNPPQVSARLRGRRVLVVEDNEINREIAVELLTDAGLVIDTVENGLQAVERVAQAAGAYALVLMDLQMPVMDGYEATRQLRKSWSAAQLPIIAMTAHAYAEEKQRCFDAGMNDHVAKPIEPQVLVATLDRWLPQAAPDLPQVDGPSGPPGPAPVAAMTAAPTDALPDALPPFDIARALERVNGKRALLRKLIIGFTESQAGVPAQLRALVAEGRIDEAHRIAHTLKGLAGSLEVAPLQAAATALEQALRNDPAGDHEARIAEIDALLGPAISAGRRLTDMPAPAAAHSSAHPAAEAVASTASPDELHAMRQTLEGQIAKRSLTARSGFEAYARASGMTGAQLAAHPVKLALDRLDYAAALREMASMAD